MKILPGTGRGTMRSMAGGAPRLAPNPLHRRPGDWQVRIAGGDPNLPIPPRPGED